MSEIHPLVELLLARMKSNPEEFEIGMSRWGHAIGKVEDYGSEADRAALSEALRPIRLNEAHEWMMDELLNGDDRRKKEQQQRELEYQKMLVQQQAINATLGGGAMSQLQNAAAWYDVPTDTYALPGGSRVAARELLNRPNYLNPTPPEGLVAKIKKGLGI